MKKLYVFDLDGTLADLSHRLRYIKKPWKEIGEKVDMPKFRPNWKKFFEECDKDTPIKWVVDLFNTLKKVSGAEFLILSGRSAVVREKTEKWLIDNNIYFDYLVMRPEKNTEPDDKIKKEMMEDFLRDKDFEVQFIVDDRQRVVDMWRREGFNVLQCAKWEEK